MIYVINEELYPKGCIEEIKYTDLDNNEWVITRLLKSFYVKYNGSTPLPKTIIIQKNKIRNTGCFFVDNENFEIFYHFRNIITMSSTKSVYDILRSLFYERFKYSSEVLESEII